MTIATSVLPSFLAIISGRMPDARSSSISFSSSGVQLHGFTFVELREGSFEPLIWLQENANGGCAKQRGRPSPSPSIIRLNAVSNAVRRYGCAVGVRTA